MKIFLSILIACNCFFLADVRAQENSTAPVSSDAGSAPGVSHVPPFPFSGYSVAQGSALIGVPRPPFSQPMPGMSIMGSMYLFPAQPVGAHPDIFLENQRLLGVVAFMENRIFELEWELRQLQSARVGAEVDPAQIGGASSAVGHVLVLGKRNRLDGDRELESSLAGEIAEIDSQSSYLGDVEESEGGASGAHVSKKRKEGEDEENVIYRDTISIPVAVLREESIRVCRKACQELFWGAVRKKSINGSLLDDFTRFCSAERRRISSLNYTKEFRARRKDEREKMISERAKMASSIEQLQEELKSAKEGQAGSEISAVNSSLSQRN